MKNGQRAVANWVFIGVGMLLVQVILGGITRLTGSGLSITEWNVVTGFFPPLNHAQWLSEFDKYKHTPQYQLLNSDFNLSNFKFIFFWEWFHRFWAKLIGVVFVVGFVYLMRKRYLKPEMVLPLLILFLMGALQAAIGWIMVKSGLTDDMVYVKPLKLALHFVFALGLISYAYWYALQLSVPAIQIVRNNAIRKWTWAILAVLFFQLIYGALMAGHKAAINAASWPSINGDWIPNNMFSGPVSLIENKITVQFIHRGLAYLLFILTLIWTTRAFTMQFASAWLRKTRWLPILVVLLQVLLGILAVLNSPSIVPNHWGSFDWIAQFHQIIGLFYLVVMIWMLFIARPLKLQS